MVRLLSGFPSIDFWDLPIARVMLSHYWPDDPTLMDIALEAVRDRGIRPDKLEYESAAHYLSRCSPSQPSVADWIRRELKQQYPFAIAHGLWDCVAPFAIEHPDIKATVIARIRSESGNLMLHYFRNLIVRLRDEELRDELIRIARTEVDFTVYWAVHPLLKGWGRADPIVASFMEELTSWDDKKLGNLASLLPEIITDFDTCRARLLTLARDSGHHRFDLIASGFAALGCTADDSEVIDVLLANVGKGAPLFDLSITLLTHFSASPRVREYAQETLNAREPPLAALAQVYESDPAIRPLLLAYANPLPVTLRGDIAEVASGEANSRPAFKRVLEDYDIESDGELKIATSIYYHRYATQTNTVTSGHVKALVGALNAVGPDLDARRAAAFAGMLLLGHIDDIVPMTESVDRSLRIHTGRSYGNESDSLMALISERWDEVRDAFGADLASRFGSFGADDGHLWDCLAPHISASPAARRDFLAFCNATDTTLGLRSFVALAREQPASELLFDHCWRVFAGKVSGRYERQSAWAVERTRLEIGYILRDHFRDRAGLKEYLREAFKKWQSAKLVALALVEPEDPLLGQLRYGPRAIGERMSDWVTALHLASARSNTEEFVDAALAMINRNAHSHHRIWDFQEVTNRAVIERLQRDAEATGRFKDRLTANLTESETASLPRYLMAAGALDEEVHDRCRALLRGETRRALPRAGYDAIDDSTRPVSRSLLEVLSPSLSP